MSFPSQLEGAPPSKKRKTTTTPDRQAIPGQASGLVGAAGSTQQISVAQAPQTRPVSGPTPPNITNTPPLRWPPPSHQNTTFQPISTSTPAQHASGSNDAPPATSQSTIPANANVPPASTDTQSSATRRANLPPWEELVKSTRQLVHAMHDEGERKDEEIARLKDDLQASLDSKTIMERSHDLTIQQFNAKIKALEGDKLDLQTTARGSQALRMKLLTELGTTNEGLRTVRKELQEKSDVCDRLASRLNAANEQIRLGELERTRVSEELDTVRTTLRDRDTEVTELRKELAELHVVQSTLRDRDSKITTLENELEKLRVSESNLRGRDSEVERLKTELAELSASQASLRARDSEVSALKNELAQLRARPPAAVIQKTADIDMAQPPSSTPKRSIPGPIEHVFESWGVAKQTAFLSDFRKQRHAQNAPREISSGGEPPPSATDPPLPPANGEAPRRPSPPIHSEAPSTGRALPSTSPDLANIVKRELLPDETGLRSDMPAFVDLTLDDSDIDMDDAPSGETSAAPGASDEHGAGTANPPPGPELTAHGEDILENIPPDLATVSASATGGSLLPEVSDITEEAARSENIDAPEPEEAPTAAPPPVEIKTEEIDPLVDECASAKIMSIERLNLAFIVKNDRIRCLFCLREKPRNERNATPKWPLDVPLVGLAQHFRKAHPHYAQKLEDMTDDEVLQIS